MSEATSAALELPKSFGPGVVTGPRPKAGDHFSSGARLDPGRIGTALREPGPRDVSTVPQHLENAA